MLAEGWSVVVDAAFLKAGERARFAALAQQRGVDFRIAACHAPETELVRRLEARQHDPSEATPAIMRQQQGWLEPLDAREQACCLPEAEVGVV
jgi:predicted kinase